MTQFDYQTILPKETKRLNDRNVEFVFYDTSIEGKIGVVVKPKDDYDENRLRLTEAGYSYYKKYHKKFELFIIGEQRLLNILKAKPETEPET